MAFSIIHQRSEPIIHHLAATLASMKLLLIRHAQSANNLLFQQTGASVGRVADPPLTALGHEQAQALADFARTDATLQAVTHLYSSLTLRAVQTAAPLAGALGLGVQGLSRAYETGGLFLFDEEQQPYRVVGHSHQALAAHNPALLWPPELDAQLPWDGGYEYTSDAGIFQARAAEVIAGLRAAHGPQDTVALVTHGHFSQYLLREVLGHGEAYFRLVNTSSTCIEFSNDPETWPMVEWVGRCDHLRPEQLSV